MKKQLLQISGLLIAIAAVGCKDPNVTYAVPEANPVARATPIRTKEFVPNAPAGVGIKEPPPGGTLWANLISSRAFSARPDPFALEPRERTFEIQQGTERFAAQNPWRQDFTYAPEAVVLPVMEPQPYRRLAGVIVGDSVLALIDMGDGQLQLIHPGQVINGWRVVSIDGDKAILRRGGNVLPHEITVRLEEPPLGGGGGANPGNNNGGGRNNLGGPVGPPGGLPPGVGRPGGASGAPGGG